MKHAIRFIILFLILLIVGTGNAWSLDRSDIIINPVLPDASAGEVKLAEGDAWLSGRTVKIVVTPAAGFKTKKSLIIVEKMVDPANHAPARRAPSVGQFTLSGDANWVNSATEYTFTIPEEYDGAYITATFVSATANAITSLSDIPNTTEGLAASYELATDIDASGFEGLGEFTGTLDGKFHKIFNLSKPLFSSTRGSAIIRNITFEGVSISVSGNAGAVTASAGESTRIYNCGILPTSVERDADGNITGFYGSSVGSSSGNCGGLVGFLDGNARVINCYSYATITGGTNVGGIVGYNNGTTTASSIKTMVMNCMFYGDITGGGNVSPVYGGNNINNLQGGLNTFNYYAYDKLKTTAITEGKYNCALAVEEKYLNRFEFYRQLLNSNKKLAAFYATGSVDNSNQMAKWVLETADRTIAQPMPYPVLKAQGYYPSIINMDVKNAPDSASVGRNHGGYLGKTLSVTISSVGSNAPDGANITTGSLTLKRTDKDFDRFNYNYDKVQLPYYNEVGTGNYTGDRVVTGWKITAITSITDDPYTFDNYPTSGITDFPNHNYADRKSSNKDLYDVSGRVFSQGAYFDVPYGVTAITIEPYWAKAAYVADQYYDVVYKSDFTVQQKVSQTGTQVGNNTTFHDQKVHSTVASALSYIANETTGLGGYGPTVYDNAIVLVGNLHLGSVPSYGAAPFTMMSADDDNDHEPDYSLIYHHKDRLKVSPIRFDFLNVPGTSQAQRPNGATLACNVSIFKTMGWFEITNTALLYFSQFEYENIGATTQSVATTSNENKVDGPLILLGGVFDQFVSTQSSKVNGKVYYIHVGSNVWIKEFGLGTHSDGGESTPHVPVSVTGGDYDGFYLTGTYNQDAVVRDDNAECYISGGRFGEVAGASQEQIKGNVTWQIYDADIDNFYGGGVNAANPITGNIKVDIINSHVGTFCGGPKFGDMGRKGVAVASTYLKDDKTFTPDTDRTVETNATGCTFDIFFGAGFGGTSYSRKKYFDMEAYNFGSWQNSYTDDRGKYFNGIGTWANGSQTKYGKKGVGVATDFDYEFFIWSKGNTGGRFFVKFASFSLAQCNDVESNLKKCTINNNFYGGGNLGKVIGVATSALEDCTVHGSVYGGGFSATLPTVEVRDAGFTKLPNFNTSSGMFEPGEFSGTTTFTWQNAAVAGKTLTNGQSGSDLNNHILYTDTELTNLGEVANANLTITGTTTVDGSVYGGGEESNVAGNTQVNINGGTISQNVFGAGKGVANTFQCEKAMVYQSNVNISNGTVIGSVYGGGEIGRVESNTEVKIGAESGTSVPEIKGCVFGAGKGVATHGYSALVRGNSKVTVQGNAKVRQSVYGGGEIASVGRYTLVDETNQSQYPGLEIGMPGSLANNGSGECTVIIQGNAEIGPNNMQMTAEDGPDDAGHVFGAGKGAVPLVYTYGDIDHMPKRMMAYTSSLYPEEKKGITWEYSDAGHQNVWEYFDTEAKYLTFIETMALTTQTEVTVDGSAFVKGSVYGGSENGFVQHNTKVMIKGGQIGAGDGMSEPYGNDKFVNPATTTIATALAACAHWAYEDNGAPYDKFAGTTGYDSKGGAVIAKDGHTFYGNVFGGGSGYYPYAPGKWHRKAGSVGGDTRVEISGGHILTNVYGGNEQTDVGTYSHDENDAPTIANGGTCTIIMSGGTVGVPRTATAIEALPTVGHLYGAGKGDKRILFNTWTNVWTTSVSVSGGIIYGNVYGGGEDGHVMGNAVTTISESDANKPTVIGSVGNGGLDGNVFGGGQGSSTALTAGVVGGNVSLDIQGGTLMGSVYGGGRIASVGTYFALATDSRYGKMQDGNDHGVIAVNLTGGAIYKNVFGGCMGSTDDDALGVSKNVTVKLNENGVANAKGCIVIGDIFGCNNVNSSPQGDVIVHIYATQNANTTQMGNTAASGNTPAVNGKIKGTYDVKAVYGGGNLAAYKPMGPNPTATDDDGKNTTKSTKVIIDGCDLTSIETVYGGGNAASTPATEVTVNGTFEIKELFGGGNGKEKLPDGSDNPGANVGFYDYSAVEAQYPTKEARQATAFTGTYTYGTGKATVNIFGGTIHYVFGGSNMKGNVRQTALTLLDENSGCDFCVDEAYGGGKSAEMDAEAKLLMACIPGLEAVYGGAEAADVHGNVTLNITNGTFGRVFGGNNISGTIGGSITVNVEEIGCKPVMIGELYGGGNQAGYSVYGYKEVTENGKIVWKPRESATDAGTGPTKPYADPQVNVMSFTSIGNVYGGGFGEGATMVGNPTVNINVAKGRYADDNVSIISADSTTTGGYPIPSHAKGKIGAIFSVFGGGNAAKVIGSTTVNVGTLPEVYVVKEVDEGDAVGDYYTRNNNGTYSEASGTAQDGVTYYEKEDVVGADIRGNVYGGGNNAVVTGDTHVVIGKKKE